MKLGKTRDKVINDFNENLKTSIRILIELCLELDELDYLFTDVYQQFKEVNYGEMFSAEVKPYLLSGCFSEWDAPEDILNFHILQHHQSSFLQAIEQQNDLSVPLPAESFEKVLLSLRFDQCSKTNIEKLLNFCRQYKLVTASLHLCVIAMDNYEIGVTTALSLLKQFYLDSRSESSPPNLQIDLIARMHANSPQRYQIEHSSKYLGLKLMWAVRLFILGHKFPHSKFTKDEWPLVQVVNLVTEPRHGFIQTLLSIDAELYFACLLNVFNPSQMQFKIMEAHHLRVLQTLIDYFGAQSYTGIHRFQFKCFLAQITEHLKHQPRFFFVQLGLDLIQNQDLLLRTNQALLNRSSQSQKCKLFGSSVAHLQKTANSILSQNQIQAILKKAEPISDQEIVQILTALDETSFWSLKMIFYEKQERYDLWLDSLIKNLQASGIQGDEETIQDSFTKIIKIFCLLESRVSKHCFNQFNEKLVAKLDALVAIDAHMSVGLCEAILKGNHQQFLDLIRTADAKQTYLSKLLALKHDQMISDLKSHHNLKAWNQLLTQHFKFLCVWSTSAQVSSHVNTKVVNRLQDIALYPLSDFLQICLQEKHWHAAAILSYHTGKLHDCVILNLLYLSTTLEARALRKELYHRSLSQLEGSYPNVILLETSLNDILDLMAKNPAELLNAQKPDPWQSLIEHFQNLPLKPVLAKKAYCHVFLNDLLIKALKVILSKVDLMHVLQASRYKQMQVSKVAQFLRQAYIGKQNELKLLVLLSGTQSREEDVQPTQEHGLLCTSSYCSLCFKPIASEGVTLFSCTHAYHTACLQEGKKGKQSERCLACFKVDYEILSLQTQGQKPYLARYKKSGGSSSSLYPSAGGQGSGSSAAEGGYSETTSQSSSKFSSSSKPGLMIRQQQSSVSSQQAHMALHRQQQKKLEQAQQRQLHLKRMKLFDKSIY